MAALLSASLDTTNDVKTATTAAATNLATLGVVCPPNAKVGDNLFLVTANGNNNVAITGPTGGAGSGWTAITNGKVSDDLQFAVWTKFGIVATDVGATFNVATTGNIPMVAACIRVPNSDVALRTSATNAPTTAQTDTAANANGPAPTAMTGVLGTDLAFEVYGFSQNTAATTTITYPVAATWTQLLSVITGAGSSAFNTGIMVIAKLGGGLTGDLPQPKASTAGTWGSASLAYKPSPRVASFMPFFM